jgi:hypothetical protein
MQTAIVVVCTIIGLVIGSRGAWTFPWKAKPPMWKLVCLMLLYVVGGGGLGFMAGGWLAGQLA